MKFNLKRSLISTLIIQSIGITSATAYVVLNIINNDYFSWSIFALILSILNLINLSFLWYWWRYRGHLSTRSRLTLVLWGSLVIWYWLIAPIYFYLVMNLNTLQLKWTAFAFIWEVPILGSVFILTSLLLFRPLHKMFKSPIKPTSPLGFYKLSLNYPIYIGLLIFLISLFGYFVGAIQLRFLAAYPVIEQIKNIINGFVISVFLATFYYLVVDHLLNAVRIKIEETANLLHPPRRHIRTKVMVVSLLTSLGSLALIGLFVFTSYQQIIFNQLRVQIIRDISIVLEKSRANPDQFNITEELKLLTHGKNGITFLLQNPLTDDPRFSPETIAFINQSSFGATKDLHHLTKLVAVARIDAINSKVVSIIYPADFYGTLLQGASPVFFAAAFVLVITLSVTTIFSHFITYAITSFKQQVNKIKKTHTMTHPSSLLIGSADEVQDLSAAFISYAIQTEEFERLKNEFLSVAAHQLRTPAGIIKWSLEEILTQKHGPLNDHQYEAIEKTQHANERMIRLINNLLDVSRIDQRRVADEPTYTDFVELTKSQIKEFKSLASKKKLTLKLTNDPHLAHVKLDKSRFVAILQNLISNAIKYTHQGTIEISLKSHPKYIKLIIKDTGIGIPQSAKSHIFSKFYRADNAIDTDPDGSGLGLHIVKTYVEAWGGTITFNSTQGKGTTFQVNIPRKPKQYTLAENIIEESKK